MEGATGGARRGLLAVTCTPAAAGSSSLRAAYAVPDPRPSRAEALCFQLYANVSCGAASAAACCFAKGAAVKLQTLLVTGAQRGPVFAHRRRWA
jgi:hypothetical protein